MQLSDTSQSRLEKRDSASDRESLGGSVALYLRLWTYGGPSQPLNGLPLDQDSEVTKLIRSVLTGKGSIAEQQPQLLTVIFGSPLHALTAARELQQRFLTFQRKAEPKQVVPSILVSGTKKDPLSAATASASALSVDLLANRSSAQILVSEAVYEVVKSAPGLKFNPQPVRESGGTGGPEAIYELLWTDESTYGHLRQAGTSNGFKKVGRYEIQEELGRGAMGIVYKAYDQLIGRTIALKTIEIHRNTPDRDDLIERLKQEAKAAGGLDHPNIITIYDVGQEEDRIYLSMQFIEGKTLLAVMAENALPPLPTVISYADQILSAVGFAHARGVIHRDLKPANLMLTTQGIIKVLDFGIAKVENASLTQTGLVVGTPSHMAPEQVAGKKIDHRADIFALGSVFYELVTREKPFRGDVTTILYKIMHEDPVAPSLINPALPGGIDAIIRKALAKDPNDRFQSCEEMREAFLEQAAQLSVSPAMSAPPIPAVAKPVARTPPTFPHYLLEETKTTQKRSGRNWLGVVAAAMLVIIGVTDWAFYIKSHTGSFPSPIAKIVGAFHRSAAPLDNAKPEEIGAAPSSEGDSGNPPSDTGKTASTDSSVKPAPSPSDTKAGSQAQANGDNPAASGVPTQQPVAGPSPGNPPASDKTQSAADGHAPSVNSPSLPVAAGQAPASQQASSASGQLSGTSSPALTGTSDKGQQARAANASGNTDSGKASGTPAAVEGQSSAETTAKPVKKVAPQPAVTVDGFSRRDVPELLRQADAAVGRGDYRLAQYEYNLILKLDPSNSAARTALRRVQSAAQAH